MNHARFCGLSTRLYHRRVNLRRTITCTTLALLLAITCGCTKAKPQLFDRDRAMRAQPIGKQSRSELLDGHLLDGLNQLRNGDLAAAKTAFEAHLKEHPKSALAHYHLGLVEMDQDRFEPARRHFERALMLQPKMFGAASNLGVLYLRNGEDAAALRRLEEAEAVEPSDPRVMVNLANARLRRALWSEAMESYKEANEAVPGHASLMYNMAVALHMRHRFKQAMPLLDEAIMHRPGFQLARALRVSCLQGMGKAKAAVAYARESIAAVPESSDLQIVLGRALLASGNIDEGLDALQRAVAIDDTDPNALLALGETLDAVGKRSKAAKMYRKYLRIRVRDLQDSRRVRKRLKVLEKT